MISIKFMWILLIAGTLFIQNYYVKILLSSEEINVWHSPHLPPRDRQQRLGASMETQESGGNHAYPERCPFKSSAAIFEIEKYDKNQNSDISIVAKQKLTIMISMAQYA